MASSPTRLGQSQRREELTPMAHQALLLRFRDLVTEPGGNIAEHRRIMRLRGYVWWGWWARGRQEVTPRSVFQDFFGPDRAPAEVILFDRGLLRLYRTTASKVIVAPTDFGVNSPEFEATPAYYVRGRYPAWFRLEGDIAPIEGTSVTVVARPTTDKNFVTLDPEATGDVVPLEDLQNETPTLWVIASPSTKE